MARLTRQDFERLLEFRVTLRRFHRWSEDQAQAAFEEMLDAAIALGGTVTGEHGVGILKRDGMRRELDPGSLALQSAVRYALDPREIFNPGKN